MNTPQPPRTLLALCALALLLVSGCAVGPNYAKPELDTPDAWHQELVRGLGTGDANLETWWTVFEDPLLLSLIERATQKSPDLRGAVARVAEASARRGIAVGEWFPTVDSAVLYDRSKRSDEVLGDILPGSSLAPQNLYSAGLGASWEVDLFGRVRRSVEAADADLAATLEDYRDVLVVLYAEVAINYVEVRALQKRITYAESNVRSQQETLELVLARNRAGLVGDLDVRQAELNLARTESALPLLRESLVAAVNRLAVLTGEYPGALTPAIAPLAPVPSPPGAVGVGLPTNLLRQRPDLRRAERELAAQTARIGVATADLYPRLMLLGTFSFDAVSASNWITAAAQAWSLGPQIRWNLFDGGRIRSNVRAQDARTQQALLVYEKTVLSAVAEVEDSIAAYSQEQERVDALRRSAEAAEQSVELVKVLYRSGLTHFQNVLDMEKSLFEEQDALARSQGRVSQNLIRVYRALGGGWSP